MDTSNRNNLLKLIGGFAFAGIFSFCFYKCDSKTDTPKETRVSTPKEDPNLEWKLRLQAAKDYADTAHQLSYTESMAILEEEDKQKRENDPDYYFKHLDDYQDDPEDEIRFDPIIFEGNSD